VDIAIDLVPMCGTAQSVVAGKITETEVEFDQFVIHASGESLKKATGMRLIELGYVGKEPGSPINYLPAANRFSSKVLDEISKVIEAKLGEQRPIDGPLPPDVLNAPLPELADTDTEGSDQNL